MEKILITGTGRCGTTFLIKIFSFLNFDTGFTIDNYNDYIHENCNAGMEKGWRENHYILKNPTFIEKIDIINKEIKIKEVIIPIRDYNLSALSRKSNNNDNGGLWNARNEKEQLLFYQKIMSNYLFIMTKNDIKTIFLDFDRMVKDKEYLYNKLEHIFKEKEINFEEFAKVYDYASESSKPKEKNNNEIKIDTELIEKNNTDNIKIKYLNLLKIKK